MLRTFLGRTLGIGRNTHLGGMQKARVRRLEARVEGLESRNLMTSGSIVQTGSLVTLTPATTGPNSAIVSYQTVNNVKMIDVNLNGTNAYFSTTQVGFVYYRGTGFAGAQTFENDTSLHTVMWGGSGTNVFVSTGIGQDQFYGGTGSNTFYAGAGFDVFIGGTGSNTLYENLTGTGEFLKMGSQNTVNVPPGATGTYSIY